MHSAHGAYAPAPSVWEALKQEIKLAAPDMGIDDIGFASADPFVSLRGILQRHRELGYESGFEEPDLDKRVTPALPGTQPASLIAIAVAYPAKMSNPPKSQPGQYRGIMARSAWGRDYHQVLRDAMQRLEAFIRERVPEAVLESMVDTGALSDRAVAERAGIGFSAKNCAIISPKFGSWIYLGEMVTNLPFPPDQPVTEDCGECTRCIDACPTDALVGPGVLNAQRCVSFLTQTKGFLSDEYMRKIGNRLYGCDTCQIVCPKNKGLNWTHHAELQPDPDKAKPLLLPLLDMSNREFKEAFGDTSAAWRGRKPIQRNAVIALGNFKDASAVPKLSEVLLKDPRPELRGTAAWALGRIGGEEALNNLNKGMKSEQDEQVRSMLQQALQQLTPEEAAAGSSAPAEVDGGERTAGQPAAVGEPMGTPVIPAEVLYYDEVQTPIGTLTLVASPAGICLVEFGPFTVKEAVLQQWSRTWAGGAGYERSEEKLSSAVSQLEQYFRGELKEFTLPLDLRGTPFQVQVWTALNDIAHGTVQSYREVAEAIGRPKAVRAVGGANNKNPVPIIVPCHRVIGTDGALVGYGGGVEIKRALLQLEDALPARRGSEA
ncbi:tRNA epoxyqueuosine(34) reductase QueG [Paenibacillus sp. F411]|uniref:Methylated-DNA--protein-cysteine methyltransferase n=1 Tax=Paenibacillus algicola TaxID=2565926 RepID=A0A4P8XG06_9BACL|nr:MULTISPECIES: tRNA epoxyqueuosine(34) reductase QueG [Paenibacillus]MBO2945295.1 tRNA epoxyqueuosine(34) reductase QueG [Paenibacillus sp. F411]QCT01356.1 iron-sulfur cluster binding protein [Paenibacillus algicola]